MYRPTSAHAHDRALQGPPLDAAGARKVRPSPRLRFTSVGAGFAALLTFLAAAAAAAAPPAARAQSPELAIRELAWGQIKKGVRAIGFGGDGATWGTTASSTATQATRWSIPASPTTRMETASPSGRSAPSGTAFRPVCSSRTSCRSSTRGIVDLGGTEIYRRNGLTGAVTTATHPNLGFEQDVAGERRPAARGVSTRPPTAAVSRCGDGRSVWTSPTSTISGGRGSATSSGGPATRSWRRCRLT